MDDRWTEEALAEDRDPSWGLGSDVLFGEDHLLEHRGSAAAVLGRPTNAGPAASGEFVLPGLAYVEPEGLVSRPTATTEGGELADVVFGHPGGDLFAEGGDLRCLLCDHEQVAYRQSCLPSQVEE